MMRYLPIWTYIIWASMRKNLSLGFANNKGADQPVRVRRLISTFVIRFLERMISKLATAGENSIFWLVSVAEQAGLSLPLSETLKTGFLASQLLFVGLVVNLIQCIQLWY